MYFWLLYKLYILARIREKEEKKREEIRKALRLDLYIFSIKILLYKLIYKLN